MFRLAPHHLRRCLFTACALAVSIAHAQMVPLPQHLLRSATALDHGKGLSLNGQQFWPHWEGRIGVVVDRAYDPLKDSFVLAQPVPSSGLSLRSAHVLSDYYFSGGFRATVGLVRGSVTQSSWSNSNDDTIGSGLNLSLQRIDNLNLGDPRGQSFDGENRTLPYVGAGYAASLGGTGRESMWRFNADLGIISVNSNNIGRISRALQGEAGLDEIVRDLRLRPVIKVSVRYAF
ncbi:hypothetical protein [Aquabacterium sp.]|uniref:hypothetical protein n=1 Tax=Aquabacterium sp. TaxID=1872578 RepID=UPI00199B2079|nr:hypothetical protein [Aquabacterium sp.]MBC7699161.1 hypothetical protein [Aquabacterium sp.]